MDNKEVLSKIKPYIDKVKPFLPVSKPFLPVLATGLLLLGCVEAPAMQEIPERLQFSDIQNEESDPFLQDGTGTLNSGASLGSSPASSAASAASAAGVGNAAAKTQIAYTKPAGGYKDGTYSGTAQGFGGPVSVNVVISGGKITSITITSAAKEDKAFLDKARGVISKILAAQTPNVDAVSGATYSSNGIINAVKNALSKAGASATGESSNGNAGGNTGSAGGGTESNNPNPQNPAQPSGNITGSDNNLPDPSGKQFADGTYTGSAKGFGGNIDMQVVIENGAIKDIQILQAASETPSFLEMAKPLVNSMLSAQSTNVDAVSGATFTSNGIINGVKAALTKAAEAANNQNNTPDNPQPSDNPDPVPADTPDIPDTPADPQPSDNPDPTPADTPDIPDTPADPQPSDNPDPTPADTPDTSATPDIPSDPQPSDNPDPVPAAGKYADGSYSGKAFGFGGMIEVNIIVEGDVIRSISITSANNETPDYLEDAGAVIDSMLSAQSTDVDVVSGATYSSEGIINAVKNALKKAAAAAEEAQANQPQQTENDPAGGQTETEQKEPVDSGTSGSGTVNPPVSASKYKDGEYTGTALGWGGDITTKVTIKDGFLNAIDIISASDETASYLKGASKVTGRMLKKQSADVDVVTGATYSSRGIINSVKQALQKAEQAAVASTGEQAGE